jgi:hypothetical protein
MAERSAGMVGNIVSGTVKISAVETLGRKNFVDFIYNGLG